MSSKMWDAILDYDWTTPEPEVKSFVTELGLDNCVTERILQNRFYNPLLSSEPADEGVARGGEKYVWNQIFKRRNTDHKEYRLFVPGLRHWPPFTRLSALTEQQHVQCIKVLCSKNPWILPDEFLPRPTKVDLKAFEDLKEIYEKEQLEYIAWAKSLWTNGQCVRALRPSPTIECVYEAEFKVRAQQMKGYPTVLEVAAQLPLDKPGQFHMEILEELIGVEAAVLPMLNYPDNIRKRFNILRPCPLPEPCEQHPVRLVLPNENSISVLPIIEVQRELAEYAASNDCQFIVSEGALSCLLQRRAWTIPVAVFSVATTDGGASNVIVLGSEFCNKQENAVTRTFRAYKHLLEFAFVPSSEMQKRAQALEAREAPASASASATATALAPAAASAPPPDESDDDTDNLFIDFWEESKGAQALEARAEPATATATASASATASVSVAAAASVPLPDDSDDDFTNLFTDFHLDESKHAVNAGEDDCSVQSSSGLKHETEDTQETEGESKKTEPNLDNGYEGFGVYQCTCRDTMFELPSPRSFRKWQVKDRSSLDTYDFIVHSAHKHRGPSGEVILEPIPEYQVDLGASKQSEDRISSLALSLALRDKASVLNVRIDAESGEVITIENSSHEQFKSQHGDRGAAIASVIHSAFNQLQGLVPGQYVLQHEPSHGDNALLYAPRNTGDEHQLRLEFDKSQPAEADEAKNVKTAPELTTALLPVHKFRKMLPCTFTYHQKQIVKPKKQVHRQKTPPRALKWPKKNGRKHKK